MFYRQSLLTMHHIFVKWHYLGGTTEEVSTWNKLPDETLIDKVPIKTELSESLYHNFTSMHTDGRGELNSLITITNTSPTKLTQIRSDPWLYSCNSGLFSGALETTMLLFVHPSSAEHALNKFGFYFSPVIWALKYHLT